MAPLLFLLLLSVTAVSEHSFASRMLRILVVEADVVESVTDNVIEGTVTLRVRDVGLGAESLLGKSVKAKYSIGLQQTHPKPWFRSSSDGPILKGARMVVAVQRLGTNFRVGIVDAWATGEDKSLETGQKLISQLKKLNTATTIPDVSNGIFDAMKKGCVEEELMWERIIGSALWGNTQLLQRIADSRLHREGLRKSAQKLIDGDKRWVISDKHRSEALEAVRSTEESEMLRLRTTILKESMGQQNRFCIKPWRAGFLKIAIEAESRPPEQMRAIIDGVTAAIDAEYRRDTRQNAQLIMVQLVFDLAAASKKESARTAWEDLLLKATREGNLEAKEEVLLRLKEVKDSEFRERLREAVYDPSGRFKLVPERSE